MHQDLERVFTLVKERTGYEVSVTPLAEQATHVTMRSASRNTPIHSIFPNPKYEKYSNYLVAAQCATIMIKWGDGRGIQDFLLNDEKTTFAKAKIETKMVRKGVERGAANQYANAVVTGILAQLNSTPSEILSVRWCFNNCLGLREEQQSYVSVYLRELSAALDPKLRALAPEDIFEKNASMNAAYALAWSRLTESTTSLLPYEALGFLPKGISLVGLLDAFDENDPAIYQKSVDAWAQQLHLNGWFEWRQREL